MITKIILSELFRKMSCRSYIEIFSGNSSSVELHNFHAIHCTSQTQELVDLGHHSENGWKPVNDLLIAVKRSLNRLSIARKSLEVSHWFPSDGTPKCGCTPLVVRKAQSTWTAKFDPRTLLRKCSRKCTQQCTRRRPQKCPRRLSLFFFEHTRGSPRRLPWECSRPIFQFSRKRTRKWARPVFTCSIFSVSCFLPTKGFMQQMLLRRVLRSFFTKKCFSEGILEGVL